MGNFSVVALIRDLERRGRGARQEDQAYGQPHDQNQAKDLSVARRWESAV
jgi:hypothetical protein